MVLKVIFINWLNMANTAKPTGCGWWQVLMCGVPHYILFRYCSSNVLGPLMFSIRYCFGPSYVFNLHVNDIADSASSTLWLFADECLLCTVIKLELDTSQLQCDLVHLLQWAQTWQMKFNLAVIKCTRAHSIIAIQRLHTTRSYIRN